MRHETVNHRVSSLFNCQTMSDVIFRIGIREIPAHKFILAIASPVFYMTMFENRGAMAFGASSGMQSWRMSVVTDGAQTPGTQSVGTSVDGSGGHFHNAILRISIDHFPFDAFFEFLRFVYTDDVMITLSNATSLIFMADDFKVPNLGERCFQFLRSEIRGESVLRILSIVRTLMSKAVVCLWREAVEHRKAIQQFREMTLVERRHHLQMVAGSSRGSRSQSRLSSARNSMASLSDISGIYRHDGMTSTATSGVYDIYGGDATAMGDTSFEHIGTGAVFRKVHHLYHQLAGISEELNNKCWRCIREHTDQVITCNAWVQQPLKMVKAILRLDVCNVPEISLFRAMDQWAERKCRADGIPALPEQRREVLGEETLGLVRFPLMSLEQIQWEVVPTGLLSFKDVQSLQSIIAQGSPALGKFNSEPRHLPHHPVHEKANHRWTLKERHFEAQSGEEGIRYQALTPKVPVYFTEPGDEVDAVLGSQLLRGYIEKTVETHEAQLEAFEAGVHGGDETRAILCHSPFDRRLSMPDEPPGRRTEDDGNNDPHQKHVKHLSQMLMYAPSWLAEDNAETEQMIKNLDSAQKPKGSLSPAPAMFTNLGEQPAPQDFVRLAHGLYHFRGNQVLDMRIENGEAMVYEHEFDVDDQNSEDNFGNPTSHDLVDLPEEAIREELGIAGRDLPEEKVTLHAYLTRQ